MRKRIRILIVIAISVMFTADLLYGEIKLGKGSGYTIVIAKKANSVTKFAAEELRKYIQRITGEELSIKTDAESSSPSGKLILVGESVYTKKLKVTLDDPVPEAFLIKSVGDTLIFLGDDFPVKKGNSLVPFSYFYSRKGTVFAVYDFLEKFAGVYWLFPGKRGEVAPRRETIIVPPVDFQDHPDVEARWFWSSSVSAGEFDVPESSTAELALWRMRIRQGVPWDLGFKGGYSHCWSTLMEGNKYFDEHPEYYALRNGKRVRMWEKKSGEPRNAGPLVCTSNPEVVKIFARRICSMFNPKDSCFVSIGPNDGGQVCQCEKCMKLDFPKLYDPSEGYNGTVYTDRILSFANAIGKEVKRTHPKLKLGLMAYTYYSAPPRKIDFLETNIAIKLVEQPESYDVNEVYHKNMKEALRRWAELSSHITVSEHYDDQNRIPVSFFRSLLIKNTRWLTANKIKGMSMETHTFMPCRFLDYYILSRMLWNRDVDSEKFLRQLFNNGFGKAGATISEYYDFMNNTFTKRHKKSGLPAISGNVSRLWLPEDVANGFEILKKAKKQAGSKEVMKRIEFIKWGHQFIELFSNLTRLCKKMDDAGCIMKMAGWHDNPCVSIMDDATLDAVSCEAYITYQKLYSFLKSHAQEPGMDPRVIWWSAHRYGYAQAIEAFGAAASGKSEKILSDGFENGKLNGWQKLTRTTAGVAITKESAHSGESSLSLKGKKKKNTTSHINRVFSATGGESYVVDLRYKKKSYDQSEIEEVGKMETSPTVVIRFHSSSKGALQRYHGHGCRPVWIKKKFDPKLKGWLRLRGQFTVPKNVDANRFVLTISTSEGEWLIDDFSLGKVK